MTDDQAHQDELRPQGDPATPPEPVTAASEPATASEPSTATADGAAAGLNASWPPLEGAPVAAVPVVAAGPSRARWVVALGVVALAVIAAVAAFVVFSSQPTPEALRYVPGDAVMVVEVRPELPGDQMQNLGSLLAHFPGFLDQSTLTEKLDEAFSQLVSQANEPDFDYATDIKPWLSGPAFIAARKGSGQSVDGIPAPPGWLLSATTNGQVTCATALQGRPTTTETYNGVELLILADADVGCVMQGKQGLLGDRVTLRAALDAKSASTGMDKSERYATARTTITKDYVSTVYIDGAGFSALVTPELGSDFPIPTNPLSGLSFGQFPDWAMVDIRVEGDAFVMNTIAPKPAPPAGGPSLLPVPVAHASLITSMLPADAIVYVEAQGAGVNLLNAITEFRTIPEVNEQFQLIDGMVEMNDLLGWVDDVGVVVTGGPAPGGGVILIAKDEASASEHAGALSTIISLAGLGAEGIEIGETTVNGVKITTVTITDLGALIPPGQIPGLDPSTAGPIELAYAVKGRVLIVGTGEAFITKLLGVQPGSGLIDQAAWKQAAARLTGIPTVIEYVGIPGVISVVEGLVPASELTEWNTKIKPYVAPLDTVYGAGWTDETMTRSVLVVSVK